MGAKITLSEADKDLICEGISRGLSVQEVAEKVGVSRRTVVRIAAVDPIFEKEMAASRAIYADSLVDGLLNIAEGCETMAEVSRAKLDSENRRWIASKFSPRYADNIQVNVQHHLDLSSVLLAADNRIMPLIKSNELNTIDAVAEKVVDFGDSIDDLI